MKTIVFLVLFVGLCSGYISSSFVSSQLSKHYALSRSPLPLLRSCSRFSKARMSHVRMQIDTPSSPQLYSTQEGLEFDLPFSDTENLEIDGSKVTKVTDSAPAYAIFGSDKTTGTESFGIKIHKQVFALFVGVCALPLVPSRPCWADTLRTYALMIEKGGSVYRTGRLGMKMVEYLGHDLKGKMDEISYPPKFKEGDTVCIELNKDAGEVKMWVNNNFYFVVGGVDPACKFFVNLEGKDSSVELVPPTVPSSVKLEKPPEEDDDEKFW